MKEGHQVMIFVHSRKETVKAAKAIVDRAREDNDSEHFSCQGLPKFGLHQREVASSRNKELKELFGHGFGIHHAGMLRSDRNLSEKLFADGAINVCSQSAQQ